MFTFFIGYSFTAIFFGVAFGLPYHLDAYLARRELRLETETGHRLAVKRAVLRTLRGAL